MKFEANYRNECGEKSLCPNCQDYGGEMRSCVCGNGFHIRRMACTMPATSPPNGDNNPMSWNWNANSGPWYRPQITRNIIHVGLGSTHFHYDNVSMRSCFSAFCNLNCRNSCLRLILMTDERGERQKRNASKWEMGNSRPRYVTQWNENDLISGIQVLFSSYNTLAYLFVAAMNSGYTTTIHIAFQIPIHFR